MKKIIILVAMMATFFGARAEKLEHVLLIGFQEIGWHPDVSDEVLEDLNDFLAHWGGDEAGNGGFAYEQSYMLAVMAGIELKELVINSDYPMFNQHPERREVLKSVFNVNSIMHQPELDDVFRNGRRLALDYVATAPYALKLYRPFYQRFMGTLPAMMYEALKEVKKLFLHEAAHIWGYGESEARNFALDFLDFAGTSVKEFEIHEPVVKDNFCVCQDRKSVSITSLCDSFCSSKNDAVPTLYMELELAPEDQGKVVDIYDWCFQEYSDGLMPNCTVVTTDGLNTIEVRPTLGRGMNYHQVKVSLEALKVETIYLAALKRIDNSSTLKSNYIQLQFLEPELDLDPIETTMVSSYNCMIAAGSIAQGEESWIADQVIKQTYYFLEGSSPGYVESQSPMFYCHDQFIYGMQDSPFYPRLNLVKNVFRLFHPLDLAFMDLDANGWLDIDDKLNKSLGVYGSGLKSYFKKISFASIEGATAYGEEAELNSDEYGYILNPIIGPQKGFPKVTCPGQEEYNSDSEFYRTLGRYLQVETEALFVGLRQSVSSVSIDKGIQYPDDYVYIREGQLRKLWFHIDNGFPTSVTNQSAMRKNIYFYWPGNSQEPMVAHSGQELYKIERMPGAYSPDKRIGCIPKMMEDSEQSMSVGVGESCSSDFQCASLCCDTSVGRCNTHDPANGLLCSKDPGEQCVSSEYCGEQEAVRCDIYKTGYDNSGYPTCDLKCFQTFVKGDCMNGQCVAPEQQPIPDFDPDNYDCAQALDYFPE